MTDIEPIRVLNVVARLNVGGPAIHVTLITKYLSSPAYDSRLVSGVVGPEEGDMSYYAAAHGVEPIRLPELGRELHPLRDMITLWKLYRLIREFKPHIVHTHTAKAGFVGRLAAWLAGVPVIIHTFHGHVFHGYFSPAKTRLFILLEQFAARLSDRIITLTENLREALAETYRIAPREKIIAMPYGLDLAAFAAAQRKTGAFRQQWGIAPEAPLISIVGRLVPVKNHALFLQAAVRVRQMHPDARFAVVGDGELRASLEAQVDALGLRDVVTFTSWQRDVLPVYADSDVLVISSVNEGTPFTVIEALAAGCPVVATAVGGLPEFLDGGKLGALVPSGETEPLAAAIAATLTDPPDTAALRAEIVQRYGIERLARDLDQLYRTLLAGRTAEDRKR
ncbi:MAG: glycosyltransferase family 4 protein [Aggregatilineales bacterium]